MIRQTVFSYWDRIGGIYTIKQMPAFLCHKETNLLGSFGVMNIKLVSVFIFRTLTLIWGIKGTKHFITKTKQNKKRELHICQGYQVYIQVVNWKTYFLNCEVKPILNQMIHCQ